MANNKPLVIFYSRTDTTRKIGKEIKEALSCESEEIIDKKDRSGIVGYIISGRDALQKRLTSIQDIGREISKHDPIIIGTPIWAGTMPPALRTFLLANKDKIKNYALFSTQGSVKPQSLQKHIIELMGREPISRLILSTKEVKTEQHTHKLNKFINEIKRGRP